MIQNKDKIFLYCDRAILVCLCLLIFALPFAKAGVEIFSWTGITLWTLKRGLGYRTNGFWGLFPKTALNKALAVFFLMNILSTIFSVDVLLSFRALFCKVFKFIIIFFLMAEVITREKRLKGLLAVMIASVIFILADAIIQYVTGVDFIRGFLWAHLTASFKSSNDFSAWLIIMIPLVLGLFAEKGLGTGLKIVLLALIILLIACLLATYSRGGWIGLMIGISFMSWYAFKDFILRNKIWFVLGTTVLFVVIAIIPQSVKTEFGNKIGGIRFKNEERIGTRMKSILNTDYGGSIWLRLRLWKEALNITRDYPVTGSGLNTYSITARNYKSCEGGGIYPHNSFLQMAAETGLLGIFSFFWILFEFFRLGWRSINKHKNFIVAGLLSGVIAFLVQSSVDTNLYALQCVVLFWFILGLTVAIIHSQEAV